MTDRETLRSINRHMEKQTAYLKNINQCASLVAAVILLAFLLLIGCGLVAVCGI